VYDTNSEIDLFGLDCKVKNKKTSYNGTSRRDAFRQAKRDAGIPISQHPSKIGKVDLDDGYGNKVLGENGLPVQVRNITLQIIKENQ